MRDTPLSKHGDGGNRDVGAACCSMLQHVAVCCKLQQVTVGCTVKEGIESLVQCGAVYCNMLQYVTV